MFDNAKVGDEIEIDGVKLKVVGDVDMSAVNCCESCYFVDDEFCPEIKCDGKIFIEVKK